MNHIIVTGATGFIGSNLVKKLVENGIMVTTVVRNQSKAENIFGEQKEAVSFFQWEGSIRAIADYMRKEKVDCVVHLATCYITKSAAEDVDELIDGNITFGMKILEAMKLAGVKNLISASTSWQHYQNEDYNPVNVYAATKQAFEDILKYYTDAEGIRAIVLEIYDTYGPFDNRNKIFNRWKEILETGEEMSLSLGEQKLDYVYIEDVIDAILIAMNRLNVMQVDVKGHEEKYAISSEEVYTLKEFAEIFEEIYEKELLIKWGGKPYREREVMEPYRGTTRLLGWKPKYDLRSGLWQMKKMEQRWKDEQ